MAQQERNMPAVGAGGQGPDIATAAPQAENREAQSPIPGMSLDLYNTLSKRHSFEAIQKQQARYKTQEEFLADAKKEAEHIRFTFTKQADNATQTLSPKPLSVGQEVNGKVVKKEVLENAQLWDTKRQEAAAKLLYGEGKELSDKQKQELIEAHWESAEEKGRDEEQLAGVYNLTQEQVSREARKLPSFTKEERRKLFEAGLVGTLTSAEYAAIGINVNKYDDDPKLSRIIKGVDAIGNAGNAGEALFSRKIAQVIKLDEAAEVDSDLAQDLKADLETGLREATDDLLLKFLSYEARDQLERSVAREGGSQFAMAKVLYEYFMGQLAPTEQAEARQRLEDLEQQAEHHDAQPLREVMREMLQSYKRIKETKLRELQGGGREAVIEHEAARAPSQDRILEEVAELVPLKPVIKGLAPYLWEGFHTAVAFKEKGADTTIRHIINPFAERFFDMIKRLRDRDRMSTQEKRYTQAESWYGGSLITIFSWPENSRDMILTAMDWVKDRIAAVGERDPITTNRALEEIRSTGPTLLQNSRYRINSESVLVAEHGEILETNPEYQRAIAFTEGPPDVIANEKIMKKGNTEFGPQAKERFAANFIANFNAMFLENRYAAYLMHRLGTFKDGTFWTGHDWHEDKVLEGPIKDYRAEIQEELIDDAARGDFFTESMFVANWDLFSQQPQAGEEDVRIIRNNEDMENVRLAYKGFFELREKYGLQYSAHDPLERLLLDPGDQIRQRIEASGDAEALRRHNLRVGVFRRTKELLDRQEGFSFITRTEIVRIEKLRHRRLTEDELFDLDRTRRNERRSQLSQQLIEQGTNPSDVSQQTEALLQREMEVRRQEAVRDAIRTRMEILSKRNSYFAEESASALAKLDQAKQRGDLAECERIAWNWVKDYNSSRIQKHLPRWYPSDWDKIRLKIDRSAKVIDRSLTKEERMAMYEVAYLPQAAANDLEGQKRIKDLAKGRTEDARFGFELARSFGIFMMESSLLGGMRIRMVMKKGPHAGEYIGRLDDDEVSVLLGLIKGRINPQTREVEVERDANGEAIIIDPERKSIRIWDIVEARLAKAIEDEEFEIKPFKEVRRQAELVHNLAILSGDQARIDATKGPLETATMDLGRKLAECQFVITHAFKAKGLVDGRLPTWPHASALDNSGIKEFGNILAEYGVMVSKGIPFADFKKEIYEFLERERRGLVSETDRANGEFMEGRYPFYERDIDGNIVMEQEIDKEGRPVYLPNGQPKMAPVPAFSLFTMSDDFGEPTAMKDRPRVVNKGDTAENTMVTEAEYNISSSGGVKFVEYLHRVRLNYFPLGVWLGGKSIWDISNYIRRRNEVEVHQQKLLDSKDMPANAKAQAAAYLARKALTGGSLGEGQATPGFLNEPFDGAYKIADMLFTWVDIVGQQQRLVDKYNLNHIKTYVELRRRVRKGTKLEDADKILLEKSRQMSYLDWDRMDKEKMQDPLYKEAYGVLKNFVTWLKVEKEVEQNRIGNAPRNYAYENTLRWYFLRTLIRESVTKGDRGFIQRLGYAGEVTSEVSIKAMEVGLQDGDYLILRDYERERLAKEGALILTKALSPQDRANGFEIKIKNVTTRTFVVPTEEDWVNIIDPKVRKALETIRRRGLLEFMREEGYKIYDLDSKGRVRRNETGTPVATNNEIPDESKWRTQPQPIREDLERIKNQGQGLLDFMREEGYEVYLVDKKVVYKRGDQGSRVVYFREVLGRKIPLEVQKAMIDGDREYNLQADPKLLRAA